MIARYRCDVSLTVGEDFQVDMTISDTEAMPVSLVGAELTLVIRSYEGLAVLRTGTGEGGITVTDAVGGAFSVHVTASQLSALAPGPYWHVCTMSQAGVTDALWSGPFTVEGLA